MSDKFASMALPVDAPSRMPILHPFSNQPLRGPDGQDGFIELLSGDSQKAAAFDRKIAAQRLARRNRTSLTIEEIEAEITERMAVLTTAWLLVGLDGEVIDVPCSEANARELYAHKGMAWLREQVIAHQGNRANFSQASSTN